MTSSQFTRILNGMGIKTYENIRLPKITKIIMSQNFYVVPERDIFTFDSSSNLLKIKQFNSKIKEDGTEVLQPWSNYDYDIYFDVNNIVGIEMLSVRSRY